jgi:hypothetical protein
LNFRPEFKKKQLNLSGLMRPKYDDFHRFLIYIEPGTKTKPNPLIFARHQTKIPTKITLYTLNPINYLGV